MTMMRTLSWFALLRAFVVPGLAQQPATTPAPHAAHTPATTPAPSPGAIWANLVAGNQRFVAGKLQTRALPALCHKLASGQQPHAIILACSDSRVSPELVFDLSLGNLIL